MSEPLPHRHRVLADQRRTVAPSPTVHEPANELRAPLAAVRDLRAGGELLPMRAALAAQIEWDDADSTADVDLNGDVDDEVETPSVPPLEMAGSMSKAASVALFGHA